jgi:hypothetical protein
MDVWGKPAMTFAGIGVVGDKSPVAVVHPSNNRQDPLSEREYSPADPDFAR